MQRRKPTFEWPHPYPSLSVDSTLPEAVKQLYGEGRLISAVKWLMDNKGMSLADAYNLIKKEAGL